MALTLLAAALLIQAPATLSAAHSHNDYNRARPLTEALERGFGSVEADVCLVDGELRVAHEPRTSKKGRTLESLYLRPLWERFQKLGGKVHPDGAPLVLLVDVKTDAERTYAALKAALEPYKPMLAKYDDAKRPGAVEVLLSGNVARRTVAGEPLRVVAIDGRPDDLDANPPVDLVPWISASWIANFRWLGFGEMPEEDAKRLKDLVERTHAQGRRLRFWATPDFPPFWTKLREAGVDVIGTDNPERLAAFLRGQPTSGPR
ncbi:MAG: phosphatidylinositol-specific phospholipase C/glycerophosphodiester phosphodiesterase family protein [Fimbriimonadaceae bacterium]